MKKPLPTTISEDYQAWQAYGHTEHRWVFNKLEVALRGGLHAGPAAASPVIEGLYISRPIYNLFGMGIGAEQFYYNEEEYEEYINYKTVPPGYFWCEWLGGPHLSIDYQKYDDGSWEVSSVWEGTHYSEDNLTKFSGWTRVPNQTAPSPYELPISLDWLHQNAGIAFFNVELREGYIVEIHLRPGGLIFNDLPVGTTLVPVWKGMEKPEGEWIPDNDPDMEKYKVSGHIKEIRDGFVIVRGTS